MGPIRSPGEAPNSAGWVPCQRFLSGPFIPATPCPLCLPLPPRFLPCGFPPPSPFSVLPGACRALLAPCFLPPLLFTPALCLSVSGPGSGCLAPLCLPPVSPVGLVVTPCAPPPHFPFPSPRRPRHLPEGLGVWGGWGRPGYLSSGACTLRAPCKHKARHLSAGGGGGARSLSVRSPLPGGGASRVAPWGAHRALRPCLW